MLGDRVLRTRSFRKALTRRITSASIDCAWASVRWQGPWTGLSKKALQNGATVLFGCALLTLSVGLLTACTGEAPPSGDRYTVRGIVRDASQLGETPARLRIEHEAIEELVGVDGTVEPMVSMTMNIVVWEGAVLPGAHGNEKRNGGIGLAVGDKVSFVLDVDWLRTPTAMIVEVDRIGQQEALVLGQ